MESEETFQEIHQYLGGQGTPDERAAFEQRMLADEALATEVALQRRIRNGLKVNEYKKLFKGIHADLQREGALPTDDNPTETPSLSPVKAVKPIGNRPAWAYFAAAASILLAIGLVWYFNASPETAPVASETPATQTPVAPDPASPDLPAEKSDPGKVPTPKRKQQPQRAPLPIDNAAFFAQYFDPDVTLESPFSKEKPGLSPSAFRQWRTDTTHVYAGIRLLAQREGAQALQELQQAETSRYPQARHAAEWYIALAYLQQGDLPKCKAQLEKISADPGHIYGKQVVELLAKIH
ncbi:hypothetical protein GCM10010967_54370 [Dyadobacter beijingensis]|uniref:Tetratricopeptide repeat protein n=1 Tax=Dyadobacter beijingensis TaxID=365489 RepID=A0ABQ2IMM5_9BACT|nr:hypothetical protein [Dyadobacter beijingensis]GGN11574.1 hypothetical protein GCM10010967_54370 [Dyadobacter beijingensis]